MYRLKNYIDKNKKEMYELLKQLCHIPAPSHSEECRACFCQKWLTENGAEGVYIDEALNVVFPLNCTGSHAITVFAAHTDTVFPDTDPMPYLDDGEKIHCPGVGDDTASVVVLLMTAKYFLEQKLVPPNGILFVCNSCEEGLGNLKGTRQLFHDYSGRIAQFISFDSVLDKVYDSCVGSHRYEVTVRTKGGHSLEDFGNANAIAELAKIVSDIYKIQVPKVDDSITTYNVGSILGGTSINTIAQEAHMLCEYRSDNGKCLAIMQRKFEEIFHAAQSEEVAVEIKQIGERPCNGVVDEQTMEQMSEICKVIIEDIIQKPVSFEAASTDCNIPLSLGVPALAIGVFWGGGVHTREEWIEKQSMIPGLEVALRIALKLTNCQEEQK